MTKPLRAAEEAAREIDEAPRLINEMAEIISRRFERLVAAADAMLKMGAHEGECDNDVDDDETPRPCTKHLATCNAREAELRSALAEVKGE